MFYPLLKEKWRSYEFAPRFTIRDISTFPDISNGILFRFKLVKYLFPCNLFVVFTSLLRNQLKT